MYAAGFTSDIWSPTEKLAVPTLILWAQRGNFPRAVYEAYAERLADARIQDVDAGHLVPMERPELVVDAVLAFAVEPRVRLRSDSRAPSSRSSPRPSTPRA